MIQQSPISGYIPTSLQSTQPTKNQLNKKPENKETVIPEEGTQIDTV